MKVALLLQWLLKDSSLISSWCLHLPQWWKWPTKALLGATFRIFSENRQTYTKHQLDTSRAYSTFRLGVKNLLSSKDPTWRWWIGVFLTRFLMSKRPEIWNVTPPGTFYLQIGCHEPPFLQGSNLEMVDRGVLDLTLDVLETWNLKCDTTRAYSTFRLGTRNLLSS